jgi:hypothetical protein
MSARRRIEIPTTGIDEFFQIIGSDPFGSTSYVGLRVPTRPTATLADDNGTNIFANRYLFTGAAYSVSDGSIGRIVGYRQLVTIGATQTVGEGSAAQVREVEQLVTSPFWHFADANVSFHLRRLGPPGSQGVPANTPGPTDLRCFKFRRSDGPALLYETATVPLGYYVNLTAYTPPNAGQPYGTPLSDGHQGTFYDQRTEWRTHGAWHSLDVEVEGPDTIVAFISVAQTDPASRPVYTPPGTFFPNGLSDEEQFLLNNPTARYWRVGFSLIVEVGDRAVEIRA